MAATKIKQYLKPEQYREQGIITWSDKTFERRIKNEGLPAIKDGKGWVIDVEDFNRWMQARKQFNG